MSTTDNESLLYSKLLQYEEIIDDIKIKIELNDNILLKDKLDILYPLLDEIRDIAEKVIEKYKVYLMYFKYIKNNNYINEIIECIDLITQKIDFFREKVTEFDEFVEI